METSLKFIGKVHSSLKKMDDCPLQENENAPEASLEIFGEYAQGIKNIKAGDEIVLLTWLHRSDRTVLSCYPRRDKDAPHVGVFSTRSPDRPNPVGMHKTKVISTSGNILIVTMLEVLDQTPVIDIKPI